MCPCQHFSLLYAHYLSSNCSAQWNRSCHDEQQWCMVLVPSHFCCLHWRLPRAVFGNVHVCQLMSQVLCAFWPTQWQLHVPPCDYDEALNTYKLCSRETCVFHVCCHKVGLKPIINPFWATFPLTNIFVSITPNILHQLLQGLVKHIVQWLVTGFGSVVIDACCRSLPPNHHITIFAKGISFLSCITSQEHKNMCWILLGLIADLPLWDGQLSTWIIRAIHALLDFIYLAQFPSHSTNMFARLQESLSCFHNNKAVFIDLELNKAMTFPKLHSMTHYQQLITLFRTADNYNTEQTEQLHINFAKYAYQATNWKDEYPQMTV